MNVLGKGSYGEVVKGDDNTAIKQYKNKLHLLQEYSGANFTKNCKYVVNVKSADLSNLTLKMDLYDCSLRAWIDKNQNTDGYNSVNLLKIIKDILSGLIEIHALGLVHADIKPGNILVMLNPLRCCLGDLGFLSFCKYAKVERTSPVYREHDVSHSWHSDMFSFGITCTEIFGGIKINRQADYEEIKQIINDKVTNLLHKNLLLSITNKDKSKRFTAQEFLCQLLNIESPSVVIQQNKALPDITKNTSFLTKSQIIEIRHNFKEYASKFNINRAKKGYVALVRYLDEHKISADYFHVFIGATLLILASVFGKYKFKEDNIKNIPHIENINKVLMELMNNTKFLKTIYYN
jgi:serine/threonine protein kinase